ncbi:MAG: ABC transporter permease [Dehalococcoidia bacterium]|nr:ABC transporter permease [Dehalococcoidia bacterium]
MLIYLARRVFASAVTLLLICLITFLLMHAVPGGPFDARSEGRLSAEAIQRLEAHYGLNDPLPAQFLGLMGNLVQGDLGLSFAQSGQPVSSLLADKFLPSFLLGVMSFTFVIAVGIPLGVMAAVRRGSAWDIANLVTSTILAAVPHFVIAFLMLLIFAVGLGWVDVRLGRGFGDSIASLPRGILPAIALGAPSMAILSRLTRGSMLEVLQEDYVRTARAKGLRERTVVVRHALRNALVPVITLLGPIFATLITGSIVIESIFGLPGVGAAFIDSVRQRDYGMIMGVTLLYAVAIMAANLVVDLLYPLVDPRAARRR